MTVNHDAERCRARDAVMTVLDGMSTGADYQLTDTLIGRLANGGWDITRGARLDGNHDGPYPFILVRDDDPTGVSGTGVVAEGVEYTGTDEAEGVVALRWLSEWPTSVVFHDRGIDSVLAVHGHDGKTRVVWK